VRFFFFFFLGAPCELRVFRCLDVLFILCCAVILLLSGAPLCNCVAPSFGFLINTILLNKKKNFKGICDYLS
jgi:hypothetical protein